MNQPRKLVFLDTDILISAYEDSRCKGILDHAANHDGFQLVTSITVLGETLFKAMDNNLAEDFVISVVANLNRWDAEIMFPDESVSRLCFSMSTNYDDSRMIGQKTDKVHLAYAMSQDCAVFLTHDVGLTRYRIPRELQDAKFFKPETMTPEAFWERYLRR
jgi:predicted nucleic acid-binding protein